MLWKTHVYLNFACAGQSLAVTTGLRIASVKQVMLKTKPPLLTQDTRHVIFTQIRYIEYVF